MDIWPELAPKNYVRFFDPPNPPVIGTHVLAAIVNEHGTVVNGGVLLVMVQTPLESPVKTPDIYLSKVTNLAAARNAGVRLTEGNQLDIVYYLKKGAIH